MTFLVGTSIGTYSTRGPSRIGRFLNRAIVILLSTCRCCNEQGHNRAADRHCSYFTVENCPCADSMDGYDFSPAYRPDGKAVTHITDSRPASA